jgi:hypothetical protein
MRVVETIPWFRIELEMAKNSMSCGPLTFMLERPTKAIIGHIQSIPTSHNFLQISATFLRNVENGLWFRFDDENVRKVDCDEIFKAYGDGKSSMNGMFQFGWASGIPSNLNENRAFQKKKIPIF